MSDKIKIQLQDVHKAFGRKVVLNGLDLVIHEGESLVIIGGSGTGKSVMLKCLLGLMQPDAGSIKVDGKEVVKASAATVDDVRLNMSMLFQGAALFDSLPVWENVFFKLLQTSKISRGEARAKAPSILASVGLQKEVAELYPAELSGGMQRRVGIARAIAPRPEIILFDEPTAGLDPIISSVINDLILKNVKELGATAITITHDLASARHIADRIAMLYQGKIIWQGTVEELSNTDNQFVLQFIQGQIHGPINVDIS